MDDMHEKEQHELDSSSSSMTAPTRLATQSNAEKHPNSLLADEVNDKHTNNDNEPVKLSAFEATSSEQDDLSRPLPSTMRALRDSTVPSPPTSQQHDTSRLGPGDGHPRTLIICLDGTGDQFDSDNSNIVLFVSCLVKHSPANQVTYYQSGIGTYDQGGLQAGIKAGMDMAVGSGLGTHVKDAYKFLMQNYRKGDKIILLGFSRGAYTVRCLAGMLHKVGLLPASNGSQVNFAYQFYKDETEQGRKLAAGFKHTFCSHVEIYFLGLWDCVASVGFFPRKLPLSKNCPTNMVRYVRHAMALDERRSKFKVCQWHQEDPNLTSNQTKSLGVDEDPELGHKGKLKDTRHRTDSEKQDDAYDEALRVQFARHDAAKRKMHDFDTDVLEIWFKGTHADVGGGSVENESRHMLSRIPLRWMIRQCFECDTGILFNTERLAGLGLDVQGLWPVYKKLDRAVVEKGIQGIPKGLLRKYKRGTLAPLERRATSYTIGQQEKMVDEEECCVETADGKQVEAVDLAHYILPSEAAEDYFDSREAPSDMLNNKKFWWALEVWPVKMRVLVEDEMRWAKKVRLNLGRHRAIRQSEPKVHWSVQRLMDHDEYKLKGRCTKDTRWREMC